MAAPRLVVRTEPRHGWVKAGIAMLVAGVLALIGGAATAWLAQTTQVAFAADRAEIPHPLRFGGGGRHQLILITDPAYLRHPYVPNAIAQMDCTVDKPGGERQEIDLGRATARTETSLGEQMAAFETTPGGTTVRCDFADGRRSSNYLYVVARARKSVAVAVYVLFGAGFLLTAAGGSAFGIGRRGRTVVERRGAG